MKIRTVGAELFHTDGQTENFAYAPKSDVVCVVARVVMSVT